MRQLDWRHHTYQASSSQEHDLPKITLNELQVGSARPRGKFEVVGWRSRIPPYYSYLMSCEVQTLPSFLRVPRMNKQIQRRRQSRLNSVWILCSSCMALYVLEISMFYPSSNHYKALATMKVFCFVIMRVLLCNRFAATWLLVFWK